jgi:hypothetical protein
MSWHYRSPHRFPALFLSLLRSAAAYPETPLVFHASPSRTNLETIAEQFRWFKWCIAKDPSVASDLYRLIETYDYRTKIEEDEIGYILRLYARPTKVSEFERLNPDLAAEVSASLST